MRGPDFTTAAWHKSSHSNATGACVEVAGSHGTVGVRDSKLGDRSSIVTLGPASWNRLIRSLRQH